MKICNQAIWCALLSRQGLLLCAAALIALPICAFAFQNRERPPAKVAFTGTDGTHGTLVYRFDPGRRFSIEVGGRRLAELPDVGQFRFALEDGDRPGLTVAMVQFPRRVDVIDWVYSSCVSPSVKEKVRWKAVLGDIVWKQGPMDPIRPTRRVTVELRNVTFVREDTGETSTLNAIDIQDVDVYLGALGG